MADHTNMNTKSIIVSPQLSHNNLNIPNNAQNQTNLTNTQNHPTNAQNHPTNAQNHPTNAQNHPTDTQNQTTVAQASSPSFVMTMNDDLQFCFTVTLFIVAIGSAVMVLLVSPFVLAGTAVCFLFLAGKKLVLAMTVLKQINLSKPFRGAIIIPILDITLTILCVMSDHGSDMESLIQDHFVTWFFVRVLFCLLFDFGVFLYLQITHLVVACCVLFICVFIAITIMMVLSAVLTFCARKPLQSTCTCFDAVHKFYVMLLLFKVFSLLLSVTLMANQIALYVEVGTNATLIVFTVITTFDMVFDILCFIAMCRQKISTVAPKPSPPPSPPPTTLTLEDMDGMEDQISDITTGNSTNRTGQ